MINRLQIKEILAWTVVLLALILFSATIAYSQEFSVNVTNENGKVHISTKRVENGKTIVKDTTFQASEETDIDKIIEHFTGKSDGKKLKHIRIDTDKNKSGKQQRIMIDLDLPEITDEERKEIEKDIQKSMEGVRESLVEMRKSLQGMRIHIDGIDEKDFHFKFDHDFSFTDMHDMSSELDSLRDNDHVIIVGGEEEKPPVLEKVISKNGKQVFVYKRVNPDKKENTSTDWIENFECYPNPNSGIFKLKFNVPQANNISISIVDESGKSVYSEKLNDFKGNFFKEIDIKGKVSGACILTVTDNDNSITKKFIVK